MGRGRSVAALLRTINGGGGLSLRLGALLYGVPLFHAEGTCAALATVATLSLELTTFTTGEPGPQFSSGQPIFAALASLALYAMFVLTQTVRHRDFFLPVTSDGGVAAEADVHAALPTARTTVTSLGLINVALVAVVGLAKVESAANDASVLAAGDPSPIRGVVTGLVVRALEPTAAAPAVVSFCSRPGNASGARAWRAGWGTTICTR